jgi:hypothetical protein
VLDGFCTVEHARLAYGVVVDLVAETVDEAATKALRERMRSAPRAKAPTAATIASPRPAQAPAPRSRETQATSIQPSGPPDRRPTPAVAPPRSALSSVASGNGGSLGEALRGLRDAYGNAWSFEIVKHSTNGATIEVVGQLRANGATVRETAVAAAAQGGSLGELLEGAANDSLCKCVETLIRNGR